MTTKANTKSGFHALTARQTAYKNIKQGLDTLISFVALSVLWPIFLLLILLIKAEEGLKAPAFFTQERIGEGGCRFRLYKFRTMKLDTPHDMPTHLLENPEQYVTRIGRFLRRSSLDELPQLLNILKGDMSLSGPRPALWNQDDLIAAREDAGVHQLKPGLTGWAQIHGRDELSIPEKVALDAEYLRHFGFLIDVRCFFLSIGAVLGHKGVRA